MRKRRDDDHIELTGFPKYLHKFVRIITFPFRKPAIFIPLLILAILRYNILRKFFITFSLHLCFDKCHRVNRRPVIKYFIMEMRPR